MADILWQLAANLIPTVSGGAYQDIRRVTTEWNARLKHCGPPKIRCSMHPASPSTLFFPIFSLAREKMGPPEARQKRPRRNESLQARLLILCARFFLSKPQTEFAVWVFSCKSAATSQSRLRRASIPTPFVPSGHFPLIGGIGPWEGSLTYEKERLPWEAAPCFQLKLPSCLPERTWKWMWWTVWPASSPTLVTTR